MYLFIFGKVGKIEKCSKSKNVTRIFLRRKIRFYIYERCRSRRKDAVLSSNASKIRIFEGFGSLPSKVILNTQTFVIKFLIDAITKLPSIPLYFDTYCTNAIGQALVLV